MQALLVPFLIALAPITPSAIAQEYETSPLYQKTDSVPSSAMHRWTVTANGFNATFYLTPPHYPFPSYSEGLPVDGPKGHQIIHMWIQDEHTNRAYFAYDLVLEPVPGKQQVKCTFSPLTVASIKGGLDINAPAVPIPESVAPVILSDGDVLRIGIVMDAEHKYKLIQYIRVQVPPPPSPETASTH
jgi:hypothetical protein